ncbi:MAG: class I SAM-dependent methyltransferase [Planctomycetota bacterium]
MLNRTLAQCRRIASRGVHRLTSFFTLNAPMRIVDITDGMISIPEAQLLYDLATEVTAPNGIVELGSYRGRSAVALSLGAQQAGHGVAVYSIEPHRRFTGILGGQFGPVDRAAYYRNMLRSGCWENVNLVNLPSEQVAPGFSVPVQLLFIDGDHSEAGVRRDWEHWSPLLVKAGKVAFDDSQDPQIGPYKLLTELLASGLWREVASVGKVRVIARTSS